VNKFSKRTRHARGQSRHLIESFETRRLLASISAATPYNGQASVGVGSDVLVTFGSAMNASTLTATNVSLRDSNGALVPSALSYNATTRVLTLNPTPSLVSNSGYYSVRVVGGASGVKGTDNTALSSDFVTSFTCGTPNITQQAVWSGLNNPTNIEFSPDGRVYIAEKSGIIKLFDNLTDTTPTQVADFRTSVHNFWDRGLLGMALHPQFTSGSPYIYVLYTYDGSIGGSSPTWGTAGGTDDGGGSSPTGTGVNASARLSRFTVNASGVMVAGSEQILIADWNQQFPSHSIGDLKFGPDGYLYASGGDGASFNTVDYGQFANGFGDPTNEGGALRSQDILSDGDPASLDGSVIRIDPTTGAAAPNNPYSSSSDANKRRIIANGMRNPFRITFKPGTKELFIAETGWNTWEEINRIPDATDATAENFGWPAYEGMGRQSGYDGQNLPLLENFYLNPSAHTTPWFTYAHSAQVVPGSGEPTGGSTPTGVAFYQAGNYPVAYEGALFFADYARQRIYVMFKGADGQINQASRQVAGTGGVVELTTGPNGDLYAVNLSTGTITKLVVGGANRAPVAVATFQNVTTGFPLTVNFDGRGSYDPDGSVLTYAWDLDNDGAFDDSTSATPTVTYTTPADITARLRVADSGGLTGTTSIIVNVLNLAPVPTINAPLSSLRWKVGDTINFSGSATDPEDGALAASKLSWTLNLIHSNEINPANVHTHQITSFNGVSSGSFIAPEHEYPSWLELSLTATDSKGLAATTTLRIDPKTVILSFLTSPAGLNITINGGEFTAPVSRTVIVGSNNLLAVAPSQVLNGTTYNFASWSQGGASSQMLVAPDGAATYTATFNAATSSIPAAPTLVSGVVLPGAQVKLTWTDASTNETSFVFQRRYQGWIWEDLAMTAAANATTATDTTSIGGVGYEYRVAAKNASGTSPWSNGVLVDTSVIGAQPPAAPTGLTAAAISNTRVDLAWTDNSANETGFRVERRVVGGTFAPLNTTGANIRAYSDLAAVAGTTYEYRVLATDGTLFSAASNTATVTTPGGTGTLPAAPSNFTAVVQPNRSVQLTWKDNSTNETGFRVQRRYKAWIWEDLVTLGANVISYNDTAVFAGAGYEYRVVAINGAGSSAPSNGVEVDIPAAAQLAVGASVSPMPKKKPNSALPT
jgi:glucose/arabinose dehydrogenase